MSTRTKYILGGAAGAIIAWWLLPGWLAWLLIIAIVAVPAVAYMMLDSSQKQRLKRVGRKRLGG